MTGQTTPDENDELELDLNSEIKPELLSAIEVKGENRGPNESSHIKINNVLNQAMRTGDMKKALEDSNLSQYEKDVLSSFSSEDLDKMKNLKTKLKELYKSKNAGYLYY